MILMSADALDEMAGNLYVYDVIEGGWKHEDDGFELNAHRVLSSIVKGMFHRDFTSTWEVPKFIAPDTVRYGLRLGRWTQQSPNDLVPASREEVIATRLANRVGETPVSQAAVWEATEKLAGNLDDLSHASTREAAIDKRVPVIQDVVRLLLVSANLQAESLGFDLVEAFDARLETLNRQFHPVFPIRSEP